jgi:hypothetical protein
MHRFLILALFLGISLALLPLSPIPIDSTAQTPSAQTASRVAPEEFKATVLANMMREAPTYRDGDRKRLRWEWWDTVGRNYLFEKNMLFQEVSDDSPYRLRPEWVFRDVTITFQEIFELPESDDETLVPIISLNALLANAPNSTFEGLPIYGKGGELKGTITRKYAVSTVDYGTSVFTGVGAGSQSQWSFIHALEYKDQRNGKIEIARGNSWDAFNLLWKDIKDRIADDMSEEKELEDRQLLRSAYASSLEESFADR